MSTETEKLIARLTASPFGTEVFVGPLFAEAASALSSYMQEVERLRTEKTNLSLNAYEKWQHAVGDKLWAQRERDVALAERDAAVETIEALRKLMPTHRAAHDSTGGYRGILGGYNVRCVCGASWVEDDPSMPFRCPRKSLLAARPALPEGEKP